MHYHQMWKKIIFFVMVFSILIENISIASPQRTQLEPKLDENGNIVTIMGRTHLVPKDDDDYYYEYPIDQE